ncbi:CO dehydrogenase/acetyl-CoA synthase complex subunit epsilon [Methanosarcinales archaeon ex4572_44]|nr:MAG: CO dehydrogenase/acetyl-CoA synthase complex subunit epsilon [Methanosarcinales archaeon ex4484_138]PHP45914.1 MAG: CO dehydrogenase/acetyl-CoA synthase complex subunit epsilon [Methanosarcinales archaeon ex4572_44]RLG26718.1 MAG: CO dehydrogenase/acetyl-CoA synthase complex subunit epsilon [Methanosarcinales archaeon]RLG27478.1 MAG: CO dehydrogenase/acetyl-CoA synthase complex subunit epsilon [Methanosarcinales archaeon]
MTKTEKKGNIEIEALKDVVVNIGGIEEEEEEWEPMGPTPMPGMADLRDWDYKLMNRYKPFYAPYCEMCCFCTFGKCDLTGGKKGACGLNMEAQQARFVTVACLIGCSAHTAHGRHMLNEILHIYGDREIDMGTSIDIEAPLTRLITGIKPKRLSDFIPVLDYVEEQIAQVMDSIHTGQEGSNIDYESKAFHVGMLDSLGKEVADIVQIVAFDMPKGDPDAPLVEIGMGCIDETKPMLLVIGHNVVPSVSVIDYMRERDLEDKIEVAGICCTALDTTRYSDKAKIVGSIGRQLRFVRSGVADVIMVDEQCIRADILEQAEKIHAPLIATNDKAMHGLVDRTKDSADDIITILVSGKEPGVVILDPVKAGEVAVRLVQIMHEKRKGLVHLPTDEEFAEYVAMCQNCDANCVIACPQGLPIGEANKAAVAGNLEPLANLFDICVGCGRCEQVCKKHIPIVDVIHKAALPLVRAEKGMVRVGRGPVRDTEIRNVGAPLVLGTIPGIIAIVGCGNYPNGTKDVYIMAKEFVERKYIVVLTGCGAMDAALYRDEDGKTLYEKYPGDFDGGCIVNIGSCVANAHIHDAAIKVAAIFARRNIRANYAEIADYILNRVGACGVAWGAMSQKAASIASGVNRIGIPVLVGPHGWKYRRAYLGRKDVDEDWMVYDARDSSQVRIEPAPEHLLLAADTLEEAIPLMARLCFRPTDNSMGRQVKLTHYMDLSMKYLGAYPKDWPVFVRGEADLPLAKKEEYLRILKEDYGWDVDLEAKKIISGPIRKMDVGFDATNLEELLKENK